MAETNGRTIWKIIGGFFLVIFLGALGSGLWQKVIAPFFDGSLRVIVKFMSIFFSSYKDFLYKEATEGFHEEHSLFLYTVFIMFMLISYIFFLSALHVRKKIEKQLGEQKVPSMLRLMFRFYFPQSRIGKTVLTIFYGTIIVTFVLFIIQARYSNRVTTYSLNSIEILSPYIDDSQTKLLKSEFLTATTAEKFYKFNKRLEELSQRYGVELPKLKPL